MSVGFWIQSEGTRELINVQWSQKFLLKVSSISCSLQKKGNTKYLKETNNYSLHSQSRKIATKATN